MSLLSLFLSCWITQNNCFLLKKFDQERLCTKCFEIKWNWENDPKCFLVFMWWPWLSAWSPGKYRATVSGWKQFHRCFRLQYVGVCYGMFHCLVKFSVLNDLMCFTDSLIYHFLVICWFVSGGRMDIPDVRPEKGRCISSLSERNGGCGIDNSLVRKSCRNSGSCLANSLWKLLDIDIW